MTTFFLIRHASCSGLGQTLWGRKPGICLNEKGEMQARRLADRFKDVTLDAIYSSPLERALQTADVLARNLNLEVKQSAAANEINFGDWAGKTFEELSSDERWRRFNSYRSMTTIPGGESFLEVQNRIVKEIEVLALQHGNARVAIVSHADVIRAAVAYFSGTPIDMIDRFEISPCSVSVVAVDTDNATLLTINNESELDRFWSD
ncbi:MAG TPA: histidine phosphatase family protein [Pyrinomonadaceae bacterium]|nr:histidine phosphatase family protein [Pyrinomonadaceae bacterium]